MDTKSSAMEVYGLRLAKRIAAEMRAEMAADPTLRRSQDPFVRGQRAALLDIDQRLSERIAKALEGQS